MTESESDPGRGPGYHPASFGGAALLAALLTAALPAGLFLSATGCLVLAFVFALFENALQHFSRVRLMSEAKRLDREEQIDRLLGHEDELFFASKVCRGVMQVAAAAFLVLALVEHGPDAAAVVAWVVGVAIFFLLVNVAVPYVLGRRFGDAILLRWLGAYGRVLLAIRPLTDLLQRVASRALRTGAAPDPAEEITDEILSAVEEGAREGSLEHTEKRMIEGIIDLREVTADHIMTPRTEMVCIPLQATVEEAIAASQEKGLSRLPVYRDTQDDVIGVLYLKDLLPYLGKGNPPPISEILRRPLFIPESKNVNELLQEMRVRHTHLAIVLDEYGGTAGLVTIEDILEEIVGEIVDEHESVPATEVVKLNERTASVDGKTHIDDLNRALDLEVPESEEYETVGGLLFNHLGRVPGKGEHYDLDGVRFTVVDSDERRIHRVKVSVIQ